MSLWNLSYSQIYCIIGATVCIYALHYVYGIRLRCMYQKEKKTFSKKNVVTSNEFKIFSQNMWCLFIVGGSKRKKRLKIFIENIKKSAPDIICMQEMPLFGLGIFLLCGDFIYVCTELNKLGFVYYTDPLNVTPYFGSSNGLIIFSKYRILLSNTKFFKNNRYFQFKGWQYVKIKISESDMVQIINLHLDPRKKEIQYKQIKEILEGNRMKIDDYSLRFCVGDFNINSNSKYKDKYKFLCQQMSETLGLNTDLFSKAKRTWSKRKKRIGSVSLDHMFVDDATKQIVRKTDLLDFQNKYRIFSDHLGLLAVIALK